MEDPTQGAASRPALAVRLECAYVAVRARPCSQLPIHAQLADAYANVTSGHGGATIALPLSAQLASGQALGDALGRGWKVRQQ